MSKVPLSVIVLTLNEELNIRKCLRSVAGWAGEVFVVDSFSSDRTTEIALEEGAQVFQHEFKGYAAQRNWALAHLPLSYDWVLFLDADEMVSDELKGEMRQLDLTSEAGAVGFYIKYRTVFMGRWIKHGGYYPTWLLRLFRRKSARWEAREVDERVCVDGPTGFLQHDLINKNDRSLTDWIDKHNRYATLEALELFKSRASRGAGGQGEAANIAAGAQGVRASFWGSQAERKRWMRTRIWPRLPVLIRPFLYFAYRYVFRLGFLDGKEGFIFHFLQGLWYRFVVDLKLQELERGSRR